MPIKIARLISFANICITDPHQRDEFKEKIFKHLEENDAETLARLISGDY